MSQAAEMPVRVRLLRLEPGQSATVLCLSDPVGPERDRPGGTFGHWTKGRWQPCVPADCQPAVHATPRYWRGYLAAFVFDKPAKRWTPCVLEVSESLELDMRGRYQPGQLWEISRGKQVGKKKPPYVGRLCPKQGQLEKTTPFNIVPIVENFYHVAGLDLRQCSDQPDRVYLHSVAAEGSMRDPAEPTESERATPAQVEALKRRLGVHVNGKGGA